MASAPLFMVTNRKRSGDDLTDKLGSKLLYFKTTAQGKDVKKLSRWTELAQEEFDAELRAARGRALRAPARHRRGAAAAGGAHAGPEELLPRQDLGDRPQHGQLRGAEGPQDRRLGRSGLADRGNVWDNVFDVDVTDFIVKEDIHSAVFESPDALALLERILRGVDRRQLPAPPRET